MEKVTLGEGILSALFIIASVIRYFQNRKQTEAVKQASQIAANSAVIKVGEEAAITREEVKHLVDAAISATVNERMAHAEALSEVRKILAVVVKNLTRVCAKVGVSWEDDITVVKEPKKS